MLANALVPEKLSAIRRCPLFGVSAIGRFLKYSIYGKRSWYIAHCPLYGRCPLFGVSAKRGSTVYVHEREGESVCESVCFWKMKLTIFQLIDNYEVLNSFLHANLTNHVEHHTRYRVACQHSRSSREI